MLGADSSLAVSSIPNSQIPGAALEADASDVHNKLSHTAINSSTIVSADFAQGECFKIFSSHFVYEFIMSLCR